MTFLISPRTRLKSARNDSQSALAEILADKFSSVLPADNIEEVSLLLLGEVPVNCQSEAGYSSASASSAQLRVFG
jgi:hypothetical protein